MYLDPRSKASMLSAPLGLSLTLPFLLLTSQGQARPSQLGTYRGTETGRPGAVRVRHATVIHRHRHGRLGGLVQNGRRLKQEMVSEPPPFAHYARQRSRRRRVRLFSERVKLKRSGQPACSRIVVIARLRLVGRSRR